MFRSTLFVLVIALCVVLKTWAEGPKRSCTNDEAQGAEAIAAIANSWSDLHKYFLRYAHCDDGAIAEGFSESITLLLSEQWASIKKIQAIVEKDPAFRHFVIQHIDETVPAERLKQINNNATTKCPDNLKNFCHDIKTATSQ